MNFGLLILCLLAIELLSRQPSFSLRTLQKLVSNNSETEFYIFGLLVLHSKKALGLSHSVEDGQVIVMANFIALVCL